MKDKEIKVIDNEEYVYNAEIDDLIPLYKKNDRTGICYKLDYEKTWTYLPMLELPEYDEDYSIGFYGRERERYLKENMSFTYSYLKNLFKLTPHLIDIDKAGYEMEDRLIEEYANAEGVTAELKMKAPFDWAARMNNIKHRVREVVLNEIVYVGGSIE